MEKPAVATIGLTGGIASGKSTAAKYFASLDVEVVDADRIAREVVEPGGSTLAEIVKAFGAEVLDVRGELDRKKMAARVFADEQARQRLNRIIHPAIAARSVQKLENARARASKTEVPYVIYEAPLLIENDIHKGMDGVIVVDVSTVEQHRRLTARDSLTTEQVDARLRAQMPVSEKRTYADWLIDNSSDLEHLRAEVARVHDSICKHALAVETSSR